MLPASAVGAQGGDAMPVYIVQPGENLTQIAQKFNIAVNDLINANAFLDPNLISAGTELRLPGFVGVSGRLVARPVQFGENLSVVLRETQLSRENFLRMNNITSPAEMYIGSNIVLPVLENNPLNNSRLSGQEDSTLLLSARNGLNPWILPFINGIRAAEMLPGEVLFFSSDQVEERVSLVSDQIEKVEISPLPVVQGRTSVIRAYAKTPVVLGGSINNKPLVFYYSEADGFYYAIHGFHALAEPGLATLNLTGTSEDGDSFVSEQMLLLASGNYFQEELTVEDTTIQQDIIQAENQEVQEILNASGSDKYWQGFFRFPVLGSLEDDTIAFSSVFGSRRSYNRGQYEGYHGGLDFSVVLMNLDVYAPAAGRVIYTGEMPIRGKTIFIDHGQGVVSGYGHLNNYYVAVGDFVEPGQLIGEIGKTGRVTGSHLHWDIFINGTPVDPFDWVRSTYP
jgi:murein DD-endopeptidase MepM/ murein hydrolase activator NlpD